MRELHECQAEVFRRSEKRIKEHKQRRKQMLLACIPLVLCVSVFGAFVLSGMESAGPTAGQAPEISNEKFSGAMGTDVVGGLFTGSVAVSGNGISRDYTAAEDVQEIIRLLNNIVSVAETAEGDEPINCETNKTSTERKGDYKGNGYRIFVKQSDGSSAEYLLAGSLLIDQSTQEEFHMSEDTCKDLKDALDIPR